MGLPWATEKKIKPIFLRIKLKISSQGIAKQKEIISATHKVMQLF